MAFITCDRHRKKGGEWVHAEECMKVFKHKMDDPQVNPSAAKVRLNADWQRYQKATIFMEMIKSDRFPPGFKMDVHIDLIMAVNGRAILLAPKSQAA